MELLRRENFSSGAPLEDTVGYSRAVRIGNMVFVGGTTTTTPEGVVEAEGDAYLQTKIILQKIEQALIKAGAKLSQVYRVRIYVTDIANNAIGVIDKSREYRIYIRDERLSWPDAFSFGPDGRLYTVTNQLHRSAALHGGEQSAVPPFYIFAFEALAGGVSGR